MAVNQIRGRVWAIQCGADSVSDVLFDQGEEGGDILDAIVQEGRCRACGTPWDRVVKVDGESARELCGLLPLRGWRNAKVQQILPGGA